MSVSPSDDEDFQCTKLNWVSASFAGDGDPRIFPSFLAAYEYMHQEFAVNGCDGMHFVDRGTDTTKFSVVYRYGCFFHRYIQCPFIVHIRALVSSYSSCVIRVLVHSCVHFGVLLLVSDHVCSFLFLQRLLTFPVGVVCGSVPAPGGFEPTQRVSRLSSVRAGDACRHSTLQTHQLPTHRRRTFHMESIRRKTRLCQ